MKADKNKYIETIKKYYHDGRISFIVGSGFSKNISKEYYLNWKELLTDAIKEMYAFDIQKNRNLLPTKFQDSLSIEDEVVKDVINQYGYLGTASEYIRRKGFREAIDIYIEKRTPILRSEDGETKLLLNEKVVDENPDLKVHEALIGLSVKNIYTFNYDNALDYVAGALDNGKLRNEYSYKIKLCDEFLDLIQEVDEQDCCQFDSLESGSNKKRLNEILNKLDVEDSEDEAKQIEIVKNRKDEYEAQLSNSLGKYYLIKRSEDITLCESQKNIWKLHGSIRLDDSEPYGFDGDLSVHYIISQEDYDSYSIQHEAFANYMKIALLKDCFCIIGFSCDDPNFLNWIHWVRNILKDIPADQRRIFFIDAMGGVISDEKKMLFKNHNIDYISLVSDKKEETPSQRLCSFFNDIKKPLVQSEMWCSLQPFLDYRRSKSIDDNIMKKATVMWNDYQSFIPQYTEQSVTGHIISKMAGLLKGGEVVSEEQLKLLILAIKVDGELIDNCLDDEALSVLKEKCEPFEDVKRKYQLLLLRANLLRGVNTDETILKEEDAVTYEKIWQTLFSLDFKQAKTIYCSWKPKETIWRIKGDILWQNVSDSLEVYSNGMSNNQRNFYINVATSLGLMKGLGSSVFDENGIKGWRIIREQILKKLKVEKKRLNSYGIDTISWNFGNADIEKKYACRFLQLFIETGAFMARGNYLEIPIKTWYVVFKHLYVDYPYPCLYFTLQYGDSKELKRFAQDFIYEPHLCDTVEDATDKLFKLLLQSNEDVPYYIKQGAAMILGQFIKLIKPEKWEDCLPRLYEAVQKEYAEDDCIVNFVYTAISYSTNNEFKEKILQEILVKKDNITDEDNNHLIAVRPSLKYKLHDGTMQALRNLCTCEQMKDIHLFVLFNMYSYLDSECKELFIHRLERFDFANCKSYRLLEAPFSLNVANEEIKLTIKNAILELNPLFYTGIMKEGIVHVSSGVLNLYKIMKHISFSPAEKQKLYVQINDIVQEIEDKYCINSIYLWSSKWEFANILFQSKLCLEKMRPELQGREADVENLLKEIERKLVLLNEFDSFEHVVLTDDIAIADHLFRILRNYGEVLYPYKQNKMAYQLLLHRIISKNSIELESCILFVCNFMESHKEEICREDFIGLIKVILDVYGEYFDAKQGMIWDINAQKDRVEEAMMVLYDVYKSWNRKHDFWAQYQPIYN